MNDNELSSMVRESVSGIRSSTPVDRIISRGHAMRAWRRRVPATAGALVVAGGAALGVTALAPSGHPTPTAAGKAGSHPAVVRLAAWTVAKQANGDIDITIRQLQHPAQLQATLRADGLPAHVRFSGNPDSVCQPYRPLSRNLAIGIYRFSVSNGSVVLTIQSHWPPSAFRSAASLGAYPVLSGMRLAEKMRLAEVNRSLETCLLPSSTDPPSKTGAGADRAGATPRAQCWIVMNPPSQV